MLLSILIISVSVYYSNLHNQRIEAIYSELNKEHNSYLTFIKACKQIYDPKQLRYSPFDYMDSEPYDSKLPAKYVKLKREIEYQQNIWNLYMRDNRGFIVEKMKAFQDFLSKEVIVGGVDGGVNKCYSYKMFINEKKKGDSSHGIYEVPINERLLVTFERYTLNILEQKIDTLTVKRELSL